MINTNWWRSSTAECFNFSPALSVSLLRTNVSNTNRTYRGAGQGEGVLNQWISGWSKGRLWDEVKMSERWTQPKPPHLSIMNVRMKRRKMTEDNDQAPAPRGSSSLSCCRPSLISSTPSPLSSETTPIFKMLLFSCTLSVFVIQQDSSSRSLVFSLSSPHRCLTLVTLGWFFFLNCVNAESAFVHFPVVVKTEEWKRSAHSGGGSCDLCFLFFL